MLCVLKQKILPKIQFFFKFFIKKKKIKNPQRVTTNNLKNYKITTHRHKKEPKKNKKKTKNKNIFFRF